MNGNDAIRLAHRVCAKVRHGPLGRYFIFLSCTLCGVVNCVLSTVGAHDRDDESTIRIKKGDAFGIGAIHRHGFMGDECPVSQELLPERPLSARGAACEQGHSPRRRGENADDITPVHYVPLKQNRTLDRRDSPFLVVFRVRSLAASKVTLGPTSGRAVHPVCLFRVKLRSVSLPTHFRFAAANGRRETQRVRLCANFGSHRVHSITRSASASRVAGTLTPSDPAVLRLMTNSNLVGACAGRLAGASPFRMRSI